jgi:hypothetical protein
MVALYYVSQDNPIAAQTMFYYQRYLREISEIADISALGLSDYFLWLWDCGPLVPIRYAVGRLHRTWFGYDPECQEWPYRVARWLRLSGY